MHNIFSTPPKNSKVWKFIGTNNDYSGSAGYAMLDTVWERPSGFSLFQFILGGAGQKGGSGFSGSAGTARGGGGGGASSALGMITLPSVLVPKVLFIGLPGPSVDLTVKLLPIVKCYNNNTLPIGSANFTFMYLSAFGGFPTNGTAAAGGTGGFNSSGITTALMLSGALYSGGGSPIGGANGGAPGVAGLSRNNSNPLWGAGGGGGVTTDDVWKAGGDAVRTVPKTSTYLSVSGGQSDGAAGESPVWDLEPWRWLPRAGGGGASSGAGVGGRGGDGAPGCGGGGGGGGVTGGEGGNGGPGFFIIIGIR